MAVADHTGYCGAFIWYEASLKGIGTDLGGAIKGFKKAVSEEDKDADFEQKKQVEEKSAAEPVSTKTQSDVKEKS